MSNGGAYGLKKGTTVTCNRKDCIWRGENGGCSLELIEINGRGQCIAYCDDEASL